MSDSTFDPKAILDNYRKAFAPVLKAQEQGIKTLDRVGHFQYAVAGDYLEWSLAQAKLALTVQAPGEFVAHQVELTTALSEKLRARAQEFATLAKDSAATVTATVTETTTKIAEEARKFEEAKKKAG